MRIIVRVDGSSGTVVAVRSPHTVAYLLRLSTRSMMYCRHPAASMSFTHLMPDIRCVWPVTYTFNVLPAPRAWRGHNEPGVKHLGNTWARSEVKGHRAHGGSGALLHQEVGLEPHDTWRYRSPTGRWSWCLSHMVTPEPSHAGGGPRAARHVATSEPFPAG
jgi:hypothetical protein